MLVALEKVDAELLRELLQRHFVELDEEEEMADMDTSQDNASPKGGGGRYAWGLRSYCPRIRSEERRAGKGGRSRGSP